MVTKYPRAGNRVAALRGISRRAARLRDRGIALVSVVAVLVLLMLVATPFLISMRDSARRGERALYDQRAATDAEALFQQVTARFVQNLEHIERARLDQLGEGAGATDERRPPDDCTPTSDSLAELALPEAILSQFNQPMGTVQRVWGLEVRDAQSLFELNTCSFPVLANVLGRGLLTKDIEAGDEQISVTAAVPFPADGGVIRIGREVIRYEKYSGGLFVGCKRGFASDKPGNAGADAHAEGALVVHEAAFEIACRPFRAKPGAWVRYTTPYEMRLVAEGGVTALRPEEFDALRRHVTPFSGNVVGDGWSNPQTLRAALSAADRGLQYADIENPRYFGIGTIVMITDGVNRDYAVVVETRGTNQVGIVGEIRNDYSAAQSRIYGLCRAPVNVNTATAEALALVFHGLKLRGRGMEIDGARATALAASLKKYVAPAETTAGVFRTWQDLTRALEAARDQGVIDQDQFEAVLRNALNANDNSLEFSTVPFCLRSFDVYELRATATIVGGQGQELGRREMRRMVDVGSFRSSTFVLESQADFQEQIRLSRDAKWFATYPKNVNAFYDGPNVPASEYPAYALKDRFPDSDRAPTTGDFRLLPASFRFTGQGRIDRYAHFDEQEDPDGLDLEKQALSVDLGGPYDFQGQDRKADIVRFEDVPGKGNGVNLGLAPFACSFWYKPDWSRNDNAERIIFDVGVNDPFMNRVSLRHDGSGSLRLSVCDATREQRAAEIRYDYDHGTWDAGTWYHIAVTVYGCSPDMMELFVDGEKQGTATLSTRTTSAIAPTGPISSIPVTDGSTDDFPDRGVLLLRGVDGMELVEYTSKTPNSFIVSRRKARNLNAVLSSANEVNRNHASGTNVTLYGYAAPLLTDVRRGGATNAAAIGPHRVFRAHGADDVLLQIPASGTTPASTVRHRGIANVDGYTPTVTLTEWETGSADSGIMDDVGPTGTVGFALLISRTNGSVGAATSQVITDLNGGSSQTINVTGEVAIGGVELVEYTVGSQSNTGLQVTLTRRGLASRHYDTSLVNSPTSAQNAGRFYVQYDHGYDFNGTHPLGTQYARVQFSALQFGGFDTALVPVALVGSGTGDYLDPADQEDQLGTNNGGVFTGGAAYVQVDAEWFRYDTYDTTLLPGRSVFYRDLQFDAVANLWNVSLVTETQPTPGRSPGQGGGAGNSSSTPAQAIDLNTDQFQPAAPTTTSVNTGEQPSVITMQQITAAQDFRGFQNNQTNVIQRIANTVPADHGNTSLIVPCFAVVPHGFVVSDADEGAFPGYDDLVTLRDVNGHDEHIRLQWGYRGWAAPATPPNNVWQWDRPQDTVDLQRLPTAAFTRVLKFPSGEMPDNGLTNDTEVRLRFGVKYDNSSGTTPGVVDEFGFQSLEFPSVDRDDYVQVGEVPASLAQGSAQSQAVPIQFLAIDDKADEIPVHRAYWDTGSRSVIVQGIGIPAEVFRADGGLVRINDELIFYAEVDTARGRLTGCLRGVMGTTAQNHDYGSLVIPVECFPVSRLQSAVDASGAAFELADTTDFPDAGYLRIADAGEIAGYTAYENGRLTGPLARLDPGTDDNPQNDPQRRVGGALFRGRFGTEAVGYQADDVAIAMPFRYWDRYAERADDPEVSYTQFSWTKRGAIWKRVAWDQQPRKFVTVLSTVRFQGGPAWDADHTLFKRVGQEAIPSADRNRYLFQIDEPGQLNLLNVESDRIEMRVQVRFEKGAYDRFAAVAPDHWKETPEVRRVSAEYVAPTTVLSQE